MEPKEVLDLVDPDDAECFRHLPPGWRLELMFERVGEPPGYEFRVYYMSPDGFGPFCSPEEVAAHLSSPRFCNWQGSGWLPPAFRHVPQVLYRLGYPVGLYMGSRRVIFNN